MSKPVRVNPLTVANPLKKTRKQLGLTIDQVAHRTSTIKNFIIRAEQGCYSNAPEVLINFYGGFTDLDALSLQQEYFNFQHATRKANYGRLIEPWAFPSELGLHPFINWRISSGVGSAVGICKLYCVHPAIINKFERHSHLLGNVPDQLVAALLESGYSGETLDLLELRYQEFKLGLRNGVEYLASNS